MSVAGFLLLIIIIGVAASGSKKKRGRSSASSSSSSKPDFEVPIADRKKIFKEYITAQEKIEAERQAKMNALSSDEIREKGKLLLSQARSKENNVRVQLSEKYRKKYPEASGTFVRKIIDEGIKKNWR